MARPTEAPGPAHAGRATDAAALLDAARAAARVAGVTRLANLTGLDRLGLPVWQAVRPFGRALSVHQGKGRRDADAQLGALMEAIESDLAERFVADGPLDTLGGLPSAERPLTLADFTIGGVAPPSDAIRWTRAEELRAGGTLWLPELAVSLDLTRDCDGPFERTSNGLAAGADLDNASVAALHELIERDAMIEWRGGGPLAGLAATIDPETISYRWFAVWRERLAACRIGLRIYRVPSLTGHAVCACELRDRSRAGVGYQATHGSGCHADPELALFRALAEAIQTRATFIAGARDDLGERTFRNSGGEIVVAFSLPPPSGGGRWDGRPADAVDLDALVGALADAGFAQVGRVLLGRPEGLAVVRMVVPGLGSHERRRRAPA